MIESVFSGRDNNFRSLGRFLARVRFLLHIVLTLVRKEKRGGEGEKGGEEGREKFS